METLAPQNQLADWRNHALQLEQAVKSVIVGQDKAIRHITIAIFARGHVLLEGGVGVGKTTLLQSIARGIGGAYERIEGTVDLMPNDLVGRTRGDSDDFFGSYGAEPPAAPTVAPDGLEEGTSMVGSTEEGWFSWAEGHVGSDVTGVTVHVSSGLEIEASVVGDRFAAWWPSVEPSSDNPDESWTYTVHLADGSTRETDG